MKKILGIIVLGLLLSTASFSSTKKGKGEVTIKESTVDYFIQYIRGKSSQKPLAFILSSNGYWASFYYCAHARCETGNFNKAVKECEEKTDVKCGLFARRYTIVWKNEINPGKGKVSTIKSKWSDDEIRAKLTQLGFLGGSTSSSTTSTSKIIKKKTTSSTSNNDDLTEQLKTLSELYKSGALTKEEFTKAKKKLLN